MKKIGLLGLFILSLFTLAGCGSQPTPEDTSAGTGTETNTMGTTYTQTVEFVGIGPDESGQTSADADEMVVKFVGEDSTDIVFIPNTLWTAFFPTRDFIPGVILYVNGTATADDAAAGTHYYTMTALDNLEKVNLEGVSDGSHYQQTVEFVGIGPDESGQTSADADEMVVKFVGESYVDHILIPNALWTVFFPTRDFTSGVILYMSGTVVTDDVAAGNNYYTVTSLDKLEKVNLEETQQE